MTVISSDTENILKKHFQFDRIFNLYEYDLDMRDLQADLKALTRPQYEANYRFIFLLYDTQYHVTNDQPGLTLLNLQRIVHHLDIPNYFCLVLSHHDVSEQLRQLAQSETTDDCSIDSMCHFNYYAISIWNDVCKIDPVLDINIGAITHKYQSLNRIPRFHRRALYALLEKKQLLPHGMVSFNHLGKNDV
jgi:hypothetical protein